MDIEDIEKGKSPKGGWTKKQLAKWGVPWPPPKGWKEALIKDDMGAIGASSAQQLHDVKELLRLVVMEMVNTGDAHKLYNVPGLLDYFNARIPTDEELKDAGCQPR